MTYSPLLFEEMRGIIKVSMEAIIFRAVEFRDLRKANIVDHHLSSSSDEGVWMSSASSDDVRSIHACDVYRAVANYMYSALPGQPHYFEPPSRMPDASTKETFHLARGGWSSSFVVQPSTSLTDKTFVGNCLSLGLPLGKMLLTQTDRTEARRGLEVVHAWLDKYDHIFDSLMDVDDTSLMPASQKTKPRLFDAPNQNVVGFESLLSSFSRRCGTMGSWLNQEISLPQLPDVVWMHIVSYFSRNDAAALFMIRSNTDMRIQVLRDMKMKTKTTKDAAAVPNETSTSSGTSSPDATVTIRWNSPNGRIVRTYENYEQYVEQGGYLRSTAAAQQIHEQLEIEGRTHLWFNLCSDPENFALIVAGKTGEIEPGKVDVYDAWFNVNGTPYKIVDEVACFGTNQSDVSFPPKNTLMIETSSDGHSPTINLVLVPGDASEWGSNDDAETVLRQINPGMGISQAGKETVLEILRYLEESIIQSAVEWSQISKSGESPERILQNLGSKNILFAIRAFFPGQLRRHGVAEAEKALVRFHERYKDVDFSDVQAQSIDLRTSLGLVHSPRRTAWKLMRYFEDFVENGRHFCCPTQENLEAAVLICASIEYMCAEFVELAGNEAMNDEPVSNKVTPRHIKMAVRKDDELNCQLGFNIPGGGSIARSSQQQRLYDEPPSMQFHLEDVLEECALSRAQEEVSCGVLVDSITCWNLLRKSYVKYAKIFEVAKRVDNLAEQWLGSLLSCALRVSKNVVDVSDINYAVSVHSCQFRQFLAPSTSFISGQDGCLYNDTDIIECTTRTGGTIDTTTTFSVSSMVDYNESIDDPEQSKRSLSGKNGSDFCVGGRPLNELIDERVKKVTASTKSILHHGRFKDCVVKILAQNTAGRGKITGRSISQLLHVIETGLVALLEDTLCACQIVPTTYPIITIASS